MSGFMDKTKVYPDGSQLTIFDDDYRALKPSAFKVLRLVRLVKNGVITAIDAAWELNTSPNAIRRRITDLRRIGYHVTTKRDPSTNENLYYVRD